MLRLVIMLSLLNKVSSTGDIPGSWKTTLSTMSPKHARAKMANDFRPIASLNLFYEICPYMIFIRLAVVRWKLPNLRYNVVSGMVDALRST